MNLTLIGHDDRYAVEQLQMALFPEGTAGEAVSTLHRGGTYLTAVTKITLNGRTATASRRLRAAEESVRLRRQTLQASLQRFKTLFPSFWIQPGHGDMTALIDELNYNPYLR